MPEDESDYDTEKSVYLRVTVTATFGDIGVHDIYLGEREDIVHEESGTTAPDAELIGVLSYLAEAMQEGLRPDSVPNPESQFPAGLLVIPPPSWLYEKWKVITEPVAIYDASRIESIETELLGPTR